MTNQKSCRYLGSAEKVRKGLDFGAAHEGIYEYANMTATKKMILF